MQNAKYIGFTMDFTIFAIGISKAENKGVEK
jgi:hypothetical protein